ncbi:MAG: hypothetical protein CBE26_02255 [Kiritimatiellaceae bacterium TMED266]|nr:MAG: hypothetical protein CBE26_02255 [Kiritimatiellaceae bacterium TMED266]
MKNIQTTVALSLMVVGFAEAALTAADSTDWVNYTRWDFGDTDTLLSDQGRHIGGVDNTDVDTDAYSRWESLVENGATDSNSDNSPLAAGSTRLTADPSVANYYLGAVNFGLGGSQALDADPYVYSVTGPEVKLSLGVTDIDFDAVGGNSANNAQFSVRLWDKKNESWIGIALMDNFNSDKLSYSIMSTENTLVSGGTGLTGNKNRTRAAWIQNNTNLSDPAAQEFSLRMNLATGEWGADVDGTEVATGLFVNQEDPNTAADEAEFTAIDRYQVVFQQAASAEDSIDIDYISVETIPEPATMGMLAAMGGGLMWLRRRFVD